MVDIFFACWKLVPCGDCFECINCLAESCGAVRKEELGQTALEPVAMILHTSALILCCLMLNAQTEIQRKKNSALSDSSLKCIETAEFAPCLGPQL